jgi:uncharacterized protein
MMDAVAGRSLAGKIKLLAKFPQLLNCVQMDSAKLLLIGVITGVCAGMFGIGGGVVIVPALIILMKMTQLEASGTSLAVVSLPVGILSVIQYYKAGHVNLQYALFIAAGIFAGSYFGARLALGLDPVIARRAYGVFLLVIATRFLVQGR